MTKDGQHDEPPAPDPPEPHARQEQELVFVVQKHAASHLHYDFRLELDGVLKSWAIPKGPSLDPAVKRLAMQVEDHPFDYREFEGVIPAGNYGAGEVLVWDEGSYRFPGAHTVEESTRLLRKGWQQGDLKFILQGHKLKGEFALVRLKGQDDGKSWLLIKKHDQFISGEEVTLQDRSVLTGKSLKEVREAAPAKTATPAGADPGGAQLQAIEAGQATGQLVSEKPGPLLSAEPMPRNIQPMLATSVEQPFDDPNWIFEIKLDGYRTIAEIEQGKVQLYSRKNLSFNQTFAPIVDALSGFGKDAVLDGEIVALDEQGRSSFQLLQNRQRTGLENLYYFVFDLLYLQGENLCSLPLLTRKEMLKNALPQLQRVRFSDHIAESGSSFYQLAAQNSLEGIVAKKASSRYFPGKRSREWLKIKIKLQQEAVICGYTEPRGSRRYFGSLVLGVYQDQQIIYIGLCGGGFDEEGLAKLSLRLRSLRREDSPLSQKVTADTPIQWVHPKLVCEVSFAEWTDEGVMRQPIFMGLREDKDPECTVREVPLPSKEQAEQAEEHPEQPKAAKAEDEERKPRDAEYLAQGRKIKISNINKLFWPEEGLSKRDVVEYYRKVAPFLLPHLKDRPESLLRTPEGMGGNGFFQKEVGELLLPAWIKTKEIFSKSQGKSITFFLCQDEASLLYLINLGCVELNPWLSRIQKLDYPDFLVIDLDPIDVRYDLVVEAALAVREVLNQAGAKAFPKTSGSRGLHIYVPLAAHYDYDDASRFAELVANLAHRLVPGFTSLVRQPSKRQQKVYFDYLQNKPGQTIAAPYSLRVRAGAPVSTPLRWEEVKPGLDPRAFTIGSVPVRLAEMGDLFADVLGEGADLALCLEKLEHRRR